MSNTRNVNKKILSYVLILVLTTVVFMIVKPGSTGNAIQEDSELIKIPLNDVSSKAEFYEYNKIKYFVVKASNGEIKTAFDACDVCGGTKGYRQEGGDMVCNNCGRHFNINSLGKDNIFGGGCWPGYLEHTIEENFIVIKKSDLEAGNYQF